MCNYMCKVTIPVLFAVLVVPLVFAFFLIIDRDNNSTRTDSQVSTSYYVV